MAAQPDATLVARRSWWTRTKTRERGEQAAGVAAVAAAEGTVEGRSSRWAGGRQEGGEAADGGLGTSCPAPAQDARQAILVVPTPG